MTAENKSKQIKDLIREFEEERLRDFSHPIHYESLGRGTIAVIEREREKVVEELLKKIKNLLD